MSFLNLSKQNLHHTNICIGPKDIVLKDIELYSQQLLQSGVAVEFVIFEYNVCKVEDVEKIIEKHTQKTSDTGMQIISIFLNSITIPAQNKMLKMLEEPKSNTYFFIQTHSISVFLPTIISRAQVYTYAFEKKVSKQTQDFLDGTIAERLEYIKKITEQIKKEKITKQECIKLLEELEVYVHEQRKIKELRKIIEIKEYMRESGASVKQLLEYIAVTI